LGWYVGGCNRVGRVTGDAVVYLYPDLKTALVGRWSNDCLRSAVLATVVGLETREGMPFPMVERVAGEATVFTADVSGYTNICRQPLLADPYEAARVMVARSTLPEGQEGLFAKRNLLAGQVVAFYNGIRFHDCHVSNLCDSISLLVHSRC
jgi:histone-lysine N-methyltransferase SETD7